MLTFRSAFFDLECKYDIAHIKLEVYNVELTVIVLNNDLNIRHIVVLSRNGNTVSNVCFTVCVDSIRYLNLRTVRGVLKKCIDSCTLILCKLGKCGIKVSYVTLGI